jgi:hypothetical protein
MEVFYPTFILNSGGSAHIQAGNLASVALVSIGCKSTAAPPFL